MALSTSTVKKGPSSFVHAVQWKHALQAGLIVGAVFFLLSRGIPWVGSGAINPAVMGREVSAGQEATAGLLLSVMSLHLIVAALYGLIIAPIVHEFRPFVAGLVGAAVGLVLYFLSYAITGMIMVTPPAHGEWTPLVIHIVFGIVCAEAYVGMVRRRREIPLL